MALPNPGAKEGAGGEQQNHRAAVEQGGRVAKQQPTAGGALKRGKETDINCTCSCGAMVALPSAFLPASIGLQVWIS